MTPGMGPSVARADLQRLRYRRFRRMLNGPKRGDCADRGGSTRL